MASSPAFTIVELLVVIVVIGLILAITVPGLARMAADANFNSAIQSIQSALTRVSVTAQADRNLTAIRFVPGDWDVNKQDTEDVGHQPPKGRQHVVFYGYRTTTEVPAGGNSFEIRYEERFERLPGSQSIVLPNDVWVAPAESLMTEPGVANGTSYNGNFGRDFVLRGNPGEFAYNADPQYASGREFLNADDFAVVYDPQTGLQGANEPKLYPFKAYVPKNAGGNAAGTESDRRNPANSSSYSNPDEQDLYKRFAFSGIVVYSRESFLALGDLNTVEQDRQELLARVGRSYLVPRFGGGLVMGFDENTSSQSP